MENGLFGVPMDMAGRNSVPIDGIASDATRYPLVQFDSSDINSENQPLPGCAVLSALPVEPINDLHTDIHIANGGAVVDSNALFSSLGRNVTRDSLPGSSYAVANSEFHEQLVLGTPISSNALATLLAARSGLQGNLNNVPSSGPSIYPLEALRADFSNDCSDALNSPSVSYGCNESFSTMNGKGTCGRLPVSVELGVRTPMHYSSIGISDPTSWISSVMNVSTENVYGSFKFSNELSLSLATTQPYHLSGMSVPDQSSEIHCSGAMRHCLKETMLGSEQTSCNSKELSLSCGTYRAGQFSQVISGSRFLHVIQEILAQIASYSLEKLDQMSISTDGIKTGTNSLFSSSYPMEGGTLPMISDESSNVDGRFEVRMDPTMQRHVLAAKKTQLLTLLQLVDDQYSQCLDEIHTVVSAFHAATELDPQIHTRFALHTISFLYKNLRERISNQILAMGAHTDSTASTTETEQAFATSYFQKQWTLQQLKKKEHQLWRPQRGLPERSVSVLRAWMFQNFLHPYPKDAEKHLLAVKSGLTRSQVSNWFINARVRLWKPMIEEMYVELNRRKARLDEEGTKSSSDQRSNIRSNWNPRSSAD